jgi:ABC-type dipeptide/oligopeptide/nickel transport system permease subunit
VRKGALGKQIWLGIAFAILALLLVMSFAAPESLPTPSLEDAYKWPGAYPPLGTDDRGISLLDYALQGANIVTIPALLSGALVMVFAAMAGLARCANLTWFDTALQSFSEIMGALPRLVVVLVVALALPLEWRGLLPIGITWALLAAPGAMDEAAATAGRLGGARFVEALRAHGFSAFRIYGYHVTWLNLRPVLVRQAAEVSMQVVFLEISLSYLAQASRTPALTHADSTYSWASLLYFGYQTVMVSGSFADLFDERSMLHALFLGSVLLAAVAGMAQALRMAARER